MPRSVSVWTIESHDLTPTDEPTVKPYRRIVAIENSNGTLIVCQSIGRTATRECVTRQEHLIFASDAQAARMQSYFADVVAPNDTMISYGRFHPDGNYNCYSAAEAIVGSGQRHGWREAAIMAQAGAPSYIPVDGDIPVGAQCFVVDAQAPSQPLVYHACIGLEGGDVLQVLSIAGPMGVATVPDMLEDYTCGDGRRLTLVMAPPRQDETS